MSKGIGQNHLGVDQSTDFLLTSQAMLTGLRKELYRPIGPTDSGRHEVRQKR